MADQPSPAELRALLDKQAIRDVLFRYCRAVDRADDELLMSCFHPDATDDHGSCKGTVDDLRAYLLRGTMDPAVVPGPLQHSLSNITIELEGDVAYAESYVESRAMQPDGRRENGLARYVDRVERRGGEWRIADRRVVLEYARPGFDLSEFVQGRRDRQDPSYERLPSRLS